MPFNDHNWATYSQFLRKNFLFITQASGVLLMDNDMIYILIAIALDEHVILDIHHFLMKTKLRHHVNVSHASGWSDVNGKQWRCLIYSC